MPNDFPKIWTPKEIAEITQTRLEDVLAEITSGRLRAVSIGTEFRVVDPALRAFMFGADSNQNPQKGDPLPDSTAGAAKVQWQPRAKFSFTWPDGKTKESYDCAFEAEVRLLSGEFQHFVIAYANREAAGMKDRRRVIVFLGRVPQIVPVVEFSGANDFAETKRVASVIKDAANKHIRSHSQLPTEYAGFPTVIYSDVVVGPYAAKSVAVLADNDDRDLMLRHAIIRAKYKGLIRA